MDLSGIAPAQAPPDLFTRRGEGAARSGVRVNQKTARHPAGVHRRFREKCDTVGRYR